VLRREVVEGQEDVAVLLEARHRFRVLRTVLLDEEVERLVGFVLRFGHPDLVEISLGLGVKSARQLAENVRRLVNPAALLARFRKDFAEGGPKTDGPVAHRDLRRDGKTTMLDVHEQFAPALLMFAVSVEETDDFLLSVPGGPHEYEDALALVFQADVEVDPIGPQVDVLAVAEVSFAPGLMLLDPGLREP